MLRLTTASAVSPAARAVPPQSDKATRRVARKRLKTLAGIEWLLGESAIYRVG
jgi:hypothetical protein